MRFVGIDIAAERHVFAILAEDGAVLARPTPFGEDAEGYAKLLQALAQPPGAGRHGGHRPLLEEPVRRPGRGRPPGGAAQPAPQPAFPGPGPATHQDRRHRRARPRPVRLREAPRTDPARRGRHRRAQGAGPPPRPAAAGLRRPGAPAAPPGRPRLSGVHPLCPRARQPARHRDLGRLPDRSGASRVAAPHHLAKLRYDGRHKVGCELARQLVEAARRSVGQHHGPAYRIQVRDICQDLDPLAPAPEGARARHRAACSRSTRSAAS